MNSEIKNELNQIMEAIMIKLGPDFSADIEEGMSEWQFMIMKLLHYDDCTVTDLSKHTGLTTQTVNCIIDRMYQAGHVQGIRHKADTGEVKFSLTDKGVIAFKKSWDKRDQLIDKFLLLLDKKDQDKLFEILVKILLKGGE